MTAKHMSFAEAATDVGRLHHIGIAVELEAQDLLAATLRDALGARSVNGGEDDALDVRWQWMATDHSPILELLSPRSDAASPVSQFLARTGGGLHHLSFETEQLESCRDRFTFAGLPVTGYNPDHDGWAEFFLHPRETFGALLHWMQPMSPERIAQSRHDAE